MRRPLTCPRACGCQRLRLDEWCSPFCGVVLAFLAAEAVRQDPPSDPLALPVKGPCWVGVGSATVKGYRCISIGGRNHTRQVHRVAAAVAGEPVDGLTVDHLCRNRGCCNPDHLEVVTAHENNRRGNDPAAANRRKTHCIRGHELTPDNTIARRNGRRGCKACRDDLNRRRIRKDGRYLGVAP